MSLSQIQSELGAAACNMMKIDWKDVSFPMEIPDDFQLCDSDRLILNKCLLKKQMESNSFTKPGF